MSLLYAGRRPGDSAMWSVSSTATSASFGCAVRSCGEPIRLEERCRSCNARCFRPSYAPRALETPGRRRDQPCRFVLPTDEPDVHHALDGTPAQGSAIVGKPRGKGSRCTFAFAGYLVPGGQDAKPESHSTWVTSAPSRFVAVDGSPQVGWRTSRWGGALPCGPLLSA